MKKLLVVLLLLVTQMVYAELPEITLDICNKLGGQLVLSFNNCSNGTEAMAIVGRSGVCCLTPELAEENCKKAMGYILPINESCKQLYSELEIGSQGKKCCLPRAGAVTHQASTALTSNFTQVHIGIDKEECNKLQGYTTSVIAGCKEGYYELGPLEEAKSGICCVLLPEVKPIKPGLGLVLSNFMHKIKLAFIFNKMKKAQLELSMAEQKLGLMKYYLETGKFDKAELQAKDYNRTLERINKWLSKVSNRDMEKSREKFLERIAEFEKKVEEHRLKLEGIKDKTIKRLEAKNNTNVEHIKRVFHMIEANTNTTAEKLLANKQRAILRYKAVTGKNDNETERTVREIENKVGVTRYRAIRAYIGLNSATKALILAEKTANRANNTELQQKLRERIEKLERVKENIKKGNYKEAEKNAEMLKHQLRIQQQEEGNVGIIGKTKANVVVQSEPPIPPKQK